MAGQSNHRQPAAHAAAGTDSRSEDLEPFRLRSDGEALRTDQGVKIADNQNTLSHRARVPIDAHATNALHACMRQSA